MPFIFSYLSFYMLQPHNGYKCCKSRKIRINTNATEKVFKNKIQLEDIKFMQKCKEEMTVSEFQCNTCFCFTICSFNVVEFIFGICFCFIAEDYGQKASASGCYILSFEVIKDIKDPIVMALEVENAFCHLRRQLLSLCLVLLAAQAAQKASHTWFLTEAAATHGMNSSLNTLWAAASPNLLDVQEGWGYRSPFVRNTPKWQIFKFIAGNSRQIR